jgi:hypothetical protein
MKYLLSYRQKSGKFIKLLATSNEKSLFYYNEEIKKGSIDKIDGYLPYTLCIISHDDVIDGDNFTSIYDLEVDGEIAFCKKVTEDEDVLYIDDNHKRHFIPLKWTFKVVVMPNDISVDILEKVVSGNLVDGDKVD